MKTTTYYLDELVKLTKNKSDYAVAKLLNVGHSRISNYRNGRTLFDDEIQIKVATLLGLDVRELMAAMNYHRTRSEKKKEFWLQVFKEAETKSDNLKMRQGVAKRLAKSGVQAGVNLDYCILCKIHQPLIFNNNRTITLKLPRRLPLNTPPRYPRI